MAIQIECYFLKSKRIKKFLLQMFNQKNICCQFLSNLDSFFNFEFSINILTTDNHNPLHETFIIMRKSNLCKTIRSRNNGELDNSIR